MIGNLRAAHHHRYELPLLSAPVDFESRPVPLDPYALGLLLGDGCISCRPHRAFTTPILNWLKPWRRLIPGIELRRKTDIDYVLNRMTTPGEVITIENPVTGAMRRLGLVGYEVEHQVRSGGVPVQFARCAPGRPPGSVRFRRRSGTRKQDRTCRIQFTTVVRSPAGRRHLPGAVARRRRVSPEPGKHRDGSLDWRVVETCTTAPTPTSSISVCRRASAPFRLARKVAKYDATGGGRPMRFIDRIEPAGTEEAVCIQVAAEDSLYVTEDFLLTHNTLNDAFIILDEAQNTTGEQMKMFLTRLGLRVEDRRHRRHHAGGPARRRNVRPACGDADPRRHRRHPLRRTHQRRRRAAPAGRPRSSTPTPNPRSPR